ncbi:MAG: aldose 1-epimerase [Chitinophagaceae bacterium]|nr:aldose 1-epimerase [Chitinophagaceae bacterium]
MNFACERITQEGLMFIRLSDLTSGTHADILPSFGALLHSLVVVTSQGELNVINNYPNRAGLEKDLSLSYKSSKLSPFPCRIREGRYTWQGEEFEFGKKFKDGSAIHGLLFDKEFSILSLNSDENEAVLELQYIYRREDKGYPFDYSCEVTYRLSESNTLQISTRVANLSAMPIPIADGWHPYFTLGDSVDDYTLQFDSIEILEFDAQLVPTGKLIKEPGFIHGKNLAGIELDNCFLLSKNVTQPACRLHNPKGKLSILFYPDTSYPYLQIYTPRDRQSVAIENLSAAPDSFNNGMGLKVVSPGTSATFNVSYQVQQH